MDVKTLEKEVIATIRSSLTISTLAQCTTELVLNSLDAKSTAIAVRVNPVNCQIQVIDTGEGISELNLRKIGKFYMTNKCHKLGDLQKRSGHFGFRGEALASICNAAKSVIVMSRTRQSEKTLMRAISKPNTQPVPISTRPSHGTTVTVEGMFNRLPVRQKRLKQESELDDMKRALEDLVVMHPNVSFTLRNNISGILLVNCPKQRSVKNSVKYLHPKLQEEHFKFFKLIKGEISIETLLYKDLYYNNRAQYLYVNKRSVQCLEIQKFIAVSYQKYFDGTGKKSKCATSKNKFPVYAININCPYSEFDLLISSSKSLVNFRNMPVIMKCFENVFSKFTGVEPRPQRKRKAGDDSGDDFQRSECRVSHIGGAVRGYAYKRKRHSDPTEPIPKEDDYVIEDHTKDDSENMPPTEVPDCVSKVRRPMSSKQELKRASDQNVHNENNEVNVKSKKMRLEKKPLLIYSTAKNPGNRQKEIIFSNKMCSKNEKKKNKNMKEKQYQFNIKNTVVQHNDKSRIIISQKHADQMAYLVEDSEIVNAPKSHSNVVDVSNYSSSINGKELLMNKFLKCATICKPVNDISEDIEKCQDYDFQTNNNCKIKAPILPPGPSTKIQINDMNQSINQSRTQDTSVVEVCDDLHVTTDHIESEFEYFQAQNNSQSEHSDITLPNETANFTAQTNNANNSVDNEPHNFDNHSKNQKANTEKSKSCGKDNTDSKDMTSKCIQTSMNLGNVTYKLRKSTDKINYSDVQTCRRNKFLKKMEKLAKIYESNKSQLHTDRLEHNRNIYNTIQYISRKNKSNNRKSNVNEPRKKVPQKYNLDYDSAFTDPQKDPVLFGQHSENTPYYFSYKDNTVKIFDCSEKFFPRSFARLGTASTDYSRPFQLALDNSQFAPQRILPSCVDNANFLNTFKSALQEGHASEVQPLLLQHGRSPGDETCLENANLSPIDKPKASPRHIQQATSLQRPPPSIRKKSYMSYYEHDNAEMNAKIDKDDFLKPYPIPDRGTYETSYGVGSNVMTSKDRTSNSCYAKNVLPEKFKTAQAEVHSALGDYFPDPLNRNAMLNPYNALSQHNMIQQQADPCVSNLANFSGDTTKANTNLSLDCILNTVPGEMEMVTAGPRSGIKNHFANTGSKNVPPEVSQLKINFAGVNDTFDLDRKIQTNFLHKNKQLGKINVGRTGNCYDDITGHSKIRKNVEFNVSFLDISSKFRNERLVDTCFKNTSFTSLNLTFNANQIENVGGLDRIDDISVHKLDQCNFSKLFSLNVDAQNNVSSDLFPTQTKSTCDEFRFSMTVKPVNAQSRDVPRTPILNICGGKATHQAALGVQTQVSKTTDMATSNNQIQTPAWAGEWTKILDQFGTSFYFNKRTGMTTVHSPKEESRFTLAPRSEFIPKGLSPILFESKKVDRTLSPQEKQKLRTVIIESYENELLTVKWMNYGIQNDLKHFFDELYRCKAQLYEPAVPVVNKGSAKTIRFDKSLFVNMNVIGQVDFKFIAVLTGATRHIILFDQHAVHERICLEHLQREYDKASWNLQHPVTLFLPGSDLALLVAQRSYMSDLGLAFRRLSNGLTVYGLPLCLWRRLIKKDQTNMSYLSEVTQALVDQILEIIKSKNTVGHLPPIMENAIKMEACRGAIKFGQPLSREACADLIGNLKGCALPFQCAHGRPTLHPLLQLKK